MNTTPAASAQLDRVIDLLALAGDEGVVFASPDVALAGQGEALRLELDFERSTLPAVLSSIIERLRSMPTSDGASPIAFISIPFVNTRAITAIVPKVTVCNRPGSGSLVTTVADGAIPESVAPPLLMDPPTAFDLRSSRPPKEWCDAVREAVVRIRRGDLDKVVLARELVIEADAPFSQYRVLGELARMHPTAHRFAIDGFVGASPELLVERDGIHVRALPLAGTAARSNDPAMDEAARSGLFSSKKNRSEHAFLIDMIRETLGPYCVSLHASDVPEVVSLTNVHHLATAVHGQLVDPSTDVLELVAKLHPTPAVGGRPTAKAIDVIAELEDLDRSRYAGAVGWVDASGDGRFVIAIRCAQLEGATARLYAGGGIVAASDPEHELRETQAKFQVMLPALLRL